MWEFVSELELGLSQGRRPSDTLPQVLVPFIHQLRGRLILYEPQTGHERCGPGSEERTCQATPLPRLIFPAIDRLSAEGA